MDESFERFRTTSPAGLFLDFDGTLSEIVMDPAAARPVNGVGPILDSLARRMAIVSVVSGRSAHQLLEWLGPDIEIWGVHGAEHTIGGSVVLSDRAVAHRELMQRVHEEAAEAMASLDLEGAILEDKGVMITLHYRAATDRDRAEEELGRLADELAERHGLTRVGGRQSYELRPPEEFTKAAVVLERAREAKLRAAAFVGDDRVDLPGFDALDVLAKEGLATLRVAVASSESPAELLERADVVVAGPAGVVRFLERLANTAE